MIKSKTSRALGPGAVISLVLHAVLILVLLNIVHPTLLIQQKAKTISTIVLQPPPPPPPPPPPKKPPPPPPKEPPKPIPTPPQPQQIITKAEVTTPNVPTVPPPPPPAPPAPPQPAPRVIGTGVPSAYYNTLQSLIGSNVQYPIKSQRAGEEGTCRVNVTISRDGTIEEVQLTDKAGFVALDAECRNVFSRIVKFPPVPEGVSPGITDFKIELPINFNLTEAQ